MLLLKQALLQHIEGLRFELYKTVEKFGMNSPQALAESQRLDIAINQFYKISECSINRIYIDRCCRGG